MNKRTTTTICCICFAIGGFMIAATKRALPYWKTAQAANTPVIMQYPKDLLLGNLNKVYRDTIHDTIPLEVRYDTVTTVKYKYRTRWRIKKQFVPDTIASRCAYDTIDTICVSKPVLIVPAAEDEAVNTIQ